MTFQQYILAHLPLVLFDAKVLLLWMLANYAYPSDPAHGFHESGKRGPAWIRWLATIVARSLVLACIVAWISGWSYSLGVFTLVLAIILPVVRARIASSYLAELELGANLVFACGVAGLAILNKIPPAIPAGSEPEARQEAAACIVAAIVVFVLRGGSNIVRGVLDKGKIFPEREAPGAGSANPLEQIVLDAPEYNRGRIVGILERLMLMTFVAMRAYDALAFLLTAKGLFRAKELDKPAFAEYFLVGTLTSSMIAIAGGLGIQFLLSLLW